jgi:PilZ domain
MTEETERRRARRYAIALPVRVLPHDPDGTALSAETRDISFRGLFFMAEASFKTGSEIEFILTLPRQVTLTGDVQIRCHGLIVRVEEDGRRQGVAARIDRYDFLPTAA